jgi:hypothetical protein
MLAELHRLHPMLGRHSGVVLTELRLPYDNGAALLTALEHRGTAGVFGHT